jgi:hypothetical protein
LLVLAARIAQRRPESVVIMTLLTSAKHYPKIQRELALVSGAAERVKSVFVDSRSDSC